MSRSATRPVCSMAISTYSSRQRCLDRRLAPLLLGDPRAHRGFGAPTVHGRYAMITTKDLRDIFDEATKKAGDAIGDAKIPDIGRKDDTPGFLYFSIGLVLGALV